MEKNIIVPFDAHVHLRTGPMLAAVIPYTINNFSNAVVMGNLPDPTDDRGKVLRYQEEIMSHVPGRHSFFTPIMSLMLTKNSTPEKVIAASDVAKVLKFIPGATSTNSDTGISFFELKEKYYPVLEATQRAGMIFSIHAELINNVCEIPIPEDEREARAIPFVQQIITDFPELKIVIEHVSTKAMCELVKNAPANVAATVTLHHLVLTHGHVCSYNGSIDNIFHYCKPIAKTKVDREAIKAAVFSGNEKFFFGSDSAPHLIVDKIDKGSAGIFTAPVALERLAGMFDREKALENFVSIYGRKFYGLPIPTATITFVDQYHRPPKELNGIEVFSYGGNMLRWKKI